MFEGVSGEGGGGVGEAGGVRLGGVREEGSKGSTSVIAMALSYPFYLGKGECGGKFADKLQRRITK